MDTRSLQTAPNLDASTNRKPKHKKLTKREKKLLKKQRKKRRKGEYWEPIDKTNSITLHLVHRSTNDPLLNIPDESVSEWVLEPEVNCRSDYERVQRFFSEFELEDTIPHSYRSDEFIEKTSAKSMPILPSQRHNTPYNRGGLGPIYESHYDYDYEQHYRYINDSNFQSQHPTKDAQKHKKRLKDGVEILEQYTFDEDYESDQEHKHNDDDNGDNELPSHLKEYEATQPITDQQLEHDPNYQDYMELLLSDHENEEDTTQHEPMSGDLQDDFVFQAMGVDENEFERIQLGSFEPYGARFAKWDEMDIHYDKYKDVNTKSESLYDQTINHLMNIQNAKQRNNSAYLDDIEEGSECGQFDDAEEDDSDLEDGTHVESIAYDPDKSLLDNQFEIMLNQQYGDEFIGELDDEMEELRGDGTFDTVHRFSNKNKKESLRYQYYMYLKHKKRRIRQSLKRHTRDATLQLLGIREEGDIKEEEESDEIIYFSDSDQEEKEVDIKDLDSDDERRINAEIDEEFKKEPPPKWDVESVLSTRTNHENHPMELRVNVPTPTMEPKQVKLDGNVLEDIVEMKEEEKAKELEEDEMISFVFGTIGNIGDDGDGVKVIKEKNGTQTIFEYDTMEIDGDHGENDKRQMTMADSDEDADVDMERNETIVTAFSNRKGETKEEKKKRKKLLKQMKQQRRKEKKIHKMAFKDARKKQNKLGVTQTHSHGNALRL